jgi:hypothetical protein
MVAADPYEKGFKGDQAADQRFLARGCACPAQGAALFNRPWKPALFIAGLLYQTCSGKRFIGAFFYFVGL